MHSFIEGQNLVTAAGTIVAGRQRFEIQPRAAIDSLIAIENLVVADPTGGQSVRLRDIASVRRGLEELLGIRLLRNGQPAIGIGISNKSSGNVVSMGDAVRDRIDELESLRPIEIELHFVSDQSSSVRASVNGFVGNVMLALIIVVGTLLIFMGLRSGLLMGGILLVTVAGTLIGMLWFSKTHTLAILPAIKQQPMQPILSALLTIIAMFCRSRLSMQLEIMALRHQLSVYQRSVRRPRLKAGDRLLWSWISQLWAGWQKVLIFVQPRTVIARQQKRFRDDWTRLSRDGKLGRPAVSQEIRALIRNLSQANPLWGSPRIVGELRKLGIDVPKSTVEKHRVRPRKPLSPTWKAFLENYVSEVVAIDFFVVPTVDFKVLFVLVILAHERRQVVHFNVTEQPAEQWTAQQIVEAFRWYEAPRYFEYYHHW